jgi:predicted class III extradiol MEMO1 family dioxygenase
MLSIRKAAVAGQFYPSLAAASAFASLLPFRKK